MALTASNISKSLQNISKLHPAGYNYKTWQSRVKNVLVMLDAEALGQDDQTGTSAAEVAIQKLEKQIAASIKQLLPHEVYVTIASKTTPFQIFTALDE